ncbi:putative addiction module component [Phycisphaerae bacterium RAS1]|nr:putative addiction module component [Phycisphaerae bacterium RAS1]
MSTKARRLLKEALTLDEKERAWLAEEILSGLAPGATDPGYEEAWSAEIKKRLGELDSGKVKPVPWEEVERHMRKILDEPAAD